MIYLIQSVIIKRTERYSCDGKYCLTNFGCYEKLISLERLSAIK